MGTFKGGKVGSDKAFKAALKQGGGASYMQRIPEEGRQVRLLQEPPDWVRFFEWFDESAGHYKIVTSEMEEEGVIPDGDTISKRFLVSAWDYDEEAVIPLALPASLAKALDKRYDRNQTLLDRDYDLTREGQKKKTEYEAFDDGPSTFKIEVDGEMVKVKEEDMDEMVLDLEEIVQALVDDQEEGDGDSDDDDDDDDAPRGRRSKSKGSSREKSSRGSSRRRSRDDDDDDDDDDDEDEAPRRSSRSSRSSSSSSSRRRSSRDDDDDDDDDDDEDAAPARRRISKSSGESGGIRKKPIRRNR